MDRSTFGPVDSVAHVWRDNLGLPISALDALELSDEARCYPSSFKVEHLAQCSIALSALSAALFWSVRQQCAMPKVVVPAEHACVEFKSERLYVLNGKSAPSSWGTLGGLHKTSNGYVRMHDSFINHRDNALRVLGLEKSALREDVAIRMLQWKAVEIEDAAFREGAVIAALRSFEEWDTLRQANSVADFPILIKSIAKGKPYVPPVPQLAGDKCLRGIRVLEMSRVIAAPVAGKTLAAHGSDVIWITSPTLPDLPDLDLDLSRGKRTVQFDIKTRTGKAQLLDLMRTADVFIQSYRPGSLAAHGLSTEELIRINPKLIIASLNAYGPDGPWSQHRGFDSLVQTCSGINIEDATRYGANEPARVLPCQAFDHGAGYFLATGIMAALYKRATEGGSYEVKVSLAGTMKYLRSLGQYGGKSGFDRRDFGSPEDVEQYLETRQTGFGELRAVKHSASIEGLEVGWEEMPKPLGSDKPIWL
ncbi:CoA-transferase family III [Ophiobolus disseminans]|uniref:CoA-transferase family III n=1 Tax=Ophiobolus disseminans TaxID=1469910 RepID=A0A6A6ZJR6_9PLEO|nr:CoA-transferase family III [Ophiobolus disseminans]